MKLFSTKHLTVATAIAAALLAGCTTQQTDDRPPEDIVKTRSTEHWQALMNLDFDKAYTYLAPSVKTVLSADGFKRRFSINPRQKGSPWKKTEVRSVTCADKETCQAKVFVEAQPYIPQFKGMSTTTVTDEQWVYQDGQWWLYMK
ncbi:hypothetical protein E9531_09630 [Lampropedia puyangensis]|uniref:Nuclear transport factor 2 family protein n=1 Tax=Lampropedia puyangensis TaxID=1330072 RepID=A0A4S8F4E9_9BURK|nr:hypothetical protein [Lampropedia puyangensis]THU01034.1 hypothetical protein E9531_09630 [Lampropedia puyangensis]